SYCGSGPGWIHSEGGDRTQSEYSNRARERAPSPTRGGEGAETLALRRRARPRLRHAGHDPVLLLQPLEGGDAHGTADVVVGGAIPGAVLHQLPAVHQAVAVDDQLGARRAHEIVLAAHHDRLLRAGVHAEP